MAKRLAREELTAHLEDHAAALEEKGISAEEAAVQAVEAMGDPEEIGRQLDRCHSPLLPRLSKIFALCACALFLIGFCASVLHQTGFFRYETVLLPAPTLPGWDDGDLLCEGDAQGGGHVGGYTIQAKDAALVYRPSTKFRPSMLEIQAAVTVSHWQPWLDHLTPSIPAVWTDSDGASGEYHSRSVLSLLPVAFTGCPAPLPGRHLRPDRSGKLQLRRRDRGLRPHRYDGGRDHHQK